MKNAIVTIVLTVLLVLALIWAAVVVVARTGAVDVAATADYLPGAEWFLSTLKRSSVARHAREAVERGEIRPPAEIGDRMLQHGASHYRTMCVVCHGAPGVSRGELGRGLEPQPPQLARMARERTAEEIYWVLDHGLRHTGMPAFGRSHSVEELWAITAFVETLDGMSPEEYRRRTGGAAGGHGHGDGDGDGPQGSSPTAAAAPPGTAADADGDGSAGDDGEAGHDHSDHQH